MCSECTKLAERRFTGSYVMYMGLNMGPLSNIGATFRVSWDVIWEYYTHALSGEADAHALTAINI